MNKFIWFIVAIVLYPSCAKKTYPYSAEVSFLFKEEQGTITVNSAGYGSNKVKAIRDAQKNAFQILLFKGLPGTELSVPMVENESQSKSKHADYFERFFDQENYKTFVMSSTESSELISVNGSKKIFVNVKINYNSLRKDLEQNLLIRKFGY